MRNGFHCLVVACCLIFSYLIKYLLDERIDDFLTVKLTNTKTMKSKYEKTSLTEALKKRFKNPKQSNSFENNEECLEKNSNHKNLLIYKEKFTKLSKNFLIMSKNTSKYVEILNFENNYLAFNQTNKSKTGIVECIF